MSEQQHPKEYTAMGADLKAIEDFIYSTMNHTREWELAENAYQRILSCSRPQPKEYNKPGCFGAFGKGKFAHLRDCAKGYCQWEPRCKQSQEDY